MHHNRRRKKQRPNYGKRFVDVCRSQNGFGFTISGQQPCILSCIVPNSPADTAGLRAGDFLISVNTKNVSNLPHEVVVDLINNTIGTIRLAIAENYFSDSSDDDTNIAWQNENVKGAHEIGNKNRRPKYPHHKVKLNRVQQQHQQIRQKTEIDAINDKCNKQSEYDDTVCNTVSAYNIIHSAHASNERDVNNVSAMVSPLKDNNNDNNNCDDESNLFQLEYRTVVGYLGTIEMPKQIVSNSKFQTVRSCIRKMRQEKRQPTEVLMQILPNCLKLYNSDNVLLAKYPSGRLSYVSSNNNCNVNDLASAVNGGDMRFFGLVTSSATICDLAAATSNKNDAIVSNSCHVFVIDLKLIEHTDHFPVSESHFFFYI